MERKPDDGAIAAFVDELGQRFRFPSGEREWPRYLFHVTDVQNAASILRTGSLLSRALAERQGQMLVNNANDNIIRLGDQAAHDYVRLYYRPRTPTFYCNEGIRPVKQRDDGAHCPVPVALLFDAKHVLGLAASRFTDGGHNRRSSRPNFGNDVAFLRSLPWDTIYRGNLLDGRQSDAARAEITHRLHSEVQVPAQLPLDGLHYVLTRSPAERETLLTLLGSSASLLPAARLIGVSRGGTFFNKWSFVERVDVVDGIVRVRFNGDSDTPGPFTFRIQYADPTGELRGRSREISNFRATDIYTHSIPEEYANRRFRLTLWLDDCLAYRNDILPFPAGSQLIS